MPKNPTPVYILRRIGEATLEWPICCIHESDKATLIFSSRESAQRFVDWRGFASEWEPYELPQADCHPWLEGNRRGGITAVMIDPSPDDGQRHRIVPISLLLIDPNQ